MKEAAALDSAIVRPKEVVLDPAIPIRIDQGAEQVESHNQGKVSKKRGKGTEPYRNCLLSLVDPQAVGEDSRGGSEGGPLLWTPVAVMPGCCR